MIAAAFSLTKLAKVEVLLKRQQEIQRERKSSFLLDSHADPEGLEGQKRDPSLRSRLAYAMANVTAQHAAVTNEINALRKANQELSDRALVLGRLELQGQPRHAPEDVFLLRPR